MTRSLSACPFIKYVYFFFKPWVLTYYNIQRKERFILSDKAVIIDFISRNKQVQPNIIKTDWSVWFLLEKLGSPGYACQHVNYVVITLVLK